MDFTLFILNLVNYVGTLDKTKLIINKKNYL